MLSNIIRIVEMQKENEYCINNSKEKTIFTFYNEEYYIYWVKNYKVKLINIKNEKETSWINISDFLKLYKETDYFLNKL